MKMTINEALNMMKEVNSRIRSLEALRDKVSITERFYNTAEKEKTPEYEVQHVDGMLVRLNELHFKMNNAIKNANASVQLGTEFDTAVVFEKLK